MRQCVYQGTPRDDAVLITENDSLESVAEQAELDKARLAGRVNLLLIRLHL